MYIHVLVMMFTDCKSKMKSLECSKKNVTESCKR